MQSAVHKKLRKQRDKERARYRELADKNARWEAGLSKESLTSKEVLEMAELEHELDRSGLEAWDVES